MRLSTIVLFVLAALVVACGGEDPSSSLDSNTSRTDAGQLTDASSDGSDSGHTDVVVEDDVKDDVGKAKDGFSDTEQNDPCQGKRQVRCYAWNCPHLIHENDSTYRVKVENDECLMYNNHGMNPVKEGIFWKYEGGNEMKQLNTANGEWVTCEGNLVKTSGPICSQVDGR